MSLSLHNLCLILYYKLLLINQTKDVRIYVCVASQNVRVDAMGCLGARHGLIGGAESD